MELLIKTFWNLVYIFWPKVLRVIEKTGFHSKRQPYLIGRFNSEHTIEELEQHLLALNYHHGVLSWKDPGEVLNLRLLEGQLYQYHIRVFDDGEIRVHYEYSSEGRPLGHIFETLFEPRFEYFTTTLGKFLVKDGAESSAK